MHSPSTHQQPLWLGDGCDSHWAGEPGPGRRRRMLALIVARWPRQRRRTSLRCNSPRPPLPDTPPEATPPVPAAPGPAVSGERWMPGSFAGTAGAAPEHPAVSRSARPRPGGIAPPWPTRCQPMCGLLGTQGYFFAHGTDAAASPHCPGKPAKPPPDTAQPAGGTVHITVTRPGECGGQCAGGLHRRARHPPPPICRSSRPASACARSGH